MAQSYPELVQHVLYGAHAPSPLRFVNLISRAVPLILEKTACTSQLSLSILFYVLLIFHRFPLALVDLHNIL